MAANLAEGIEAGVQLANIGIHPVWRKAEDCMLWWHIMDTINTATVQSGHATEEEEVVQNLSFICIY